MRHVDVFFYGSYINLDVLAEMDLHPSPVQVATVAGFEIVIAPLANLLPAKGALVWGILAPMTHDELGRLYDEHAQKVLGGTYLPEAVLCLTAAGDYRPALTYISPALPSGPVSEAYVERIAGPGEGYGFPDPYLRHLRSFAG